MRRKQNPIAKELRTPKYRKRVVESKKYKTKLPFSEVSKIDMMDILFMWFENLDEPSSMKLDAFRKFFGMKAIQAHEALSDTIDEAELMVKFVKFHRRQASVGKFKGAFSK